MPLPHLGWDAVVNSIFGYYSWPLRNERQHKETAPTLRCVQCARGAGAGDPCWGRWATKYPCVRMRAAACHCSFCVVSYVLLGIYFQMVKLEELSQNKNTCLGKILCCFNCCMIWFKNAFSCPLVICDFQFVPCTTYKPTQLPIIMWGENRFVRGLETSALFLSSRAAPARPVPVHSNLFSKVSNDEGCVITHSYMQCFINLTY